MFVIDGSTGGPTNRESDLKSPVELDWEVFSAKWISYKRSNISFYMHAYEKSFLSLSNQLQRTVAKEAVYLIICMQLTSLFSVTAGRCKRSDVFYYMHMTEKHFLRLTNQFQRTVTKEAIYLLTCMQMKSLFSVYRISYSGPLQKKRCMLLQFLHACDWKVFFPSNKAATAGDVSYHMHATLFHILVFL